MKIRDEQIAHLKSHRLHDFEDRACLYLQEHWPDQYKHLGELQARQSIRDAITRSARYGIDSERGIILFLNHMYALSRDFDTNPSFPWTAAILEDRSIAPAAKMEWLAIRTCQELNSSGHS